METIRLEYCPFCGYRAEWLGKGYRLMCQNCCVIMSGNSIREVVDKWNRREAQK